MNRAVPQNFIHKIKHAVNLDQITAMVAYSTKYTVACIIHDITFNP